MIVIQGFIFKQNAFRPTDSVTTGYHRNKMVIIYGNNNSIENILPC